MLVDVKVPVLAESVAEATLMAWHKKAGDTVKRGDSLIDIETDKVTLEVAAPNDGVLTEILKPDGSSVSSDQVIARIDSKGAGAQPAKPAAGSAAPKPAAKPESVPQQQSLPVVPAQESRLSPAVRNLMEEHKLNPASVKGTGPGGRITKEDVLAHLARPAPVAAAAVPAAAAAPAATAPVSAPAPQRAPIGAVPAATPTPPRTATPEPAPVVAPARTAASISGRGEQRVPMTRLRRRTAERLLSAQHENAILTTFNEVNMQPVMELRNRYKKEFEEAHGTRLGFMSFFTRAAIDALKKFPVINASVNGEDIIYHGYFDIGIAVSSPRGLVVPVLRDADQLSFAGIETAIRQYGEKARDGKLAIEDLTGGTFTITNGGVFGSLVSTPIINPPQSAILGMHKVQDRPVAENGQVLIRPMMYLALSYDHRIIDGRDAVQFLVAIKDRIEDPSRLLLQI